VHLSPSAPYAEVGGTPLDFNPKGFYRYTFGEVSAWKDGEDTKGGRLAAF
jgi:hypothetical protein